MKVFQKGREKKRKGKEKEEWLKIFNLQSNSHFLNPADL